MRRIFAIIFEALSRFDRDEGWVLTSHIALSALMAMFPFLIVLAALAGFLGTKELADEVARLMLETWPKEVAGPIATEIHNVITTARGDLLTIGAALAVFFSSSGVESLRVALNRAYDVTEARSLLVLRLESIAYVLIGAVALLVFTFLIVLGPLLFAAARRYLPWFAPIEGTLTFLRLGGATLVLVIALVIVHKWLPAGHRRFRDIFPGILATLALWLAGGTLFARYLAEFAYNYVTYYAGLASAMIALVFLYLMAAIFIYGGELNAAIRDARAARALTSSELDGKTGATE
jgi:membrane protein